MCRNAFFLLVLSSSVLLGGCLDKGGGSSKSSAPTPPAVTEPAPDETPAEPSPAPSEPPLMGAPAPSEPAPEPTPEPPREETAPAIPQPLPEKPQAPIPENFGEPSSAVLDEVNALGFYDRDKNDQPRAIRNDLDGNLKAMVQFVQSHSVEPNGNEAKQMPRLTSEREALLLVTPEQEASQLQVIVQLDGKSLGPLDMRHPDELFLADRAGSDERPDVVYSRRAWSVVLPWEWVKPGVTLRMSDDQGRSGQIGGDTIDFAPPAELVVQAIRIGMLTKPESEDVHWFSDQPARAATDYFQTVPIAKLTASQYEDVHLTRVMVGTGVIYDTASAVEGSVYAGDMRENTAKSTFSVGINLANLGVTSASMVSQHHQHLTQAVVLHHARGMYTNGMQKHGLSGGNGILTLYSSTGNEFSHEIGHHYGLGHYPGQDGSNYFLSSHHHDSGWGYIGHRKRMRANLHWTRAKNEGRTGMPADADHNSIPVYADQYSFAPDSMAGGSFNSSLSAYTHYTGYSTQTKIQPALNKAVASADSPTGYRLWDATTRKMEVHQPKVPTSDQVWYNSADGNFLKPRLFGVPVITILGGYDPQAGVGLLYPALRGNWGNVFDLPGQADDPAAHQCWLNVTFAQSPSRRIDLAPQRMHKDSNANKLHVNLAQADRPTAAALYCREPAGSARELSKIDIDPNPSAMPAAVVVGRDAGYSALREVELPQLDTALQAIAGEAFLHVDATTQALIDSYGDDPTGLSSQAQTVLAKLQQQKQSALRINRWLDAHSAEINKNNSTAISAFGELLSELGLHQTPLLPAGQSMKVNGHCMTVENLNGSIQPYILQGDLCKNGDDERWMLDLTGRVRNVQYPHLCLTHQGSLVKLSVCNVTTAAQVWETDRLPSLKRGNSCMDLLGGKPTDGRTVPNTYGCNFGSNQQWVGLTQNDNRLLLLLEARNLATVIKLASQLNAD